MKLASIIPVWVLVLAAAVVIGVVSTGYEYFTWLPIALGATIILTFVVQLSLRTKEGFVGRLVLSTVGAMVILAVATLVLTLTR
jgi:hypothetical protein